MGLQNINYDVWQHAVREVKLCSNCKKPLPHDEIMVEINTIQYLGTGTTFGWKVVCSDKCLHELLDSMLKHAKEDDGMSMGQAMGMGFL